MRKNRKSEYKVQVERHLGADILVRVYCDVDYGHGAYRVQDHFVYVDDLNDLMAGLEKALPDIEYLKRHPNLQHRPAPRKKKK